MKFLLEKDLGRLFELNLEECVWVLKQHVLRGGKTWQRCTGKNDGIPCRVEYFSKPFSVSTSGLTPHLRPTTAWKSMILHRPFPGSKFSSEFNPDPRDVHTWFNFEVDSERIFQLTPDLDKHTQTHSKTNPRGKISEAFWRVKTTAL